MYKFPLRTRHRIRSKVGILDRSMVPETNSRSKPERPVSPGRVPYSAACSSKGAVPSPSSNEVRISVCRCSAYLISSILNYSTYLIEETGSLSEDRLLLLELALSLAELLPRPVHLGQSPLVLLQLLIELIIRVLRSRSDRREWRNSSKRSDTQRRRQRRDLLLEQAQSTRHLSESSQTRREWPLERVDIGIELKYVSTL